MMNDLCFCVCVFGEYTAYIPLYIYTVLKSYHAHVLVFVEGKIPQDIRALIAQIPFGGYTIHENYWCDKPTTKQMKKARRWLLPESVFDGFEYAYLGDVDFLIVRESPTLLEAHIDHCNKTGLPFSNVIREFVDGKPALNKMAGLHFIKVKEYYAALKIDKTKWWPKITNEEILYLIIQDSFPGFKEKINTERYRPHHGFHLGLARNGKPVSAIKEQVGADWKYHSLARQQYASDKFIDTCYKLNRKLSKELGRFYKMENTK